MSGISYIQNYRLSSEKKLEIAMNLVESIVNDQEPSEDTALFINEWCVTGKRNKKVFADVWNIVLDHFNPQNTPLLYRACKKYKRICEGKIASYSGSFASALRWKRDKIIELDTEIALKSADQNDSFKFSFFPLYQVMQKHGVSAQWIPEEEYIVRETHIGTKIFKNV